MSFEQWRAIELDRPTRRRDLLFVAVADGEPVGYVSMDDNGRDGYNGLTAVRRAWRRRGIATALKRTQIAAAKRAGFERLITGSEERNLPMRSLNAKLGYRPEPSRSTLTMRGPADVRLRAWPRRRTGVRRTRASRSSRCTRRSTSPTSPPSCPASSRSRAARTRRCTAAGRGRSASTRASARRRRRTSAFAISSSSARRASRSPSTCRPSSATTRTTLSRRARSAAPASPSTRSRTCASSSTASRSTGSRPR